MKKYVIIASVIFTLAGCSASIAIADLQNAKVTPSNTVKEISAPKVKLFSAKQLIREAKIERNTDKMQDVTEYLKTRVGITSYVFSGSSPYGWDCSGLVKWAYERFGIELPHSANKQGHVGTRVSKPKLGDIVVFAYKNSTDFYHAAIYIGNGEIVHANQARGTTVIEPLSNYKTSQIRFIRIVTTN
jgi:cell wall-associated NlpC family hydrolase